MVVLITGNSGLVGLWACETLKNQRITPVGIDIKDKSYEQE